MSTFLQNRYFYKLCTISNGKLYCYSDRTIVFSLFSTFSQDLEDTANLIYVYNSPDLALSKEKQKISSWKRSQKLTIVKLMGTGEYKGDQETRAYATMTVLSDIGMPAGNKSDKTRASSLNRQPRQKTPNSKPIKISPCMLSPLRIYTSSGLRKKSPSSQINPRPISNIRGKRNLFDSVYNKYQKIKKETKWLVGQVEFLENMNKLNKLEEQDSLHSSNAYLELE